MPATHVRLSMVEITESFEKIEKFILFISWLILTRFTAVCRNTHVFRAEMYYDVHHLNSLLSFPPAKGDVGRKSGESLLYIMQMRSTEFWTEILSFRTLFSDTLFFSSSSR